MPQPAPPPASDSLMARAVRSSAFVLAGYGSAQVIRLASNLILTRLLFPEAFGVMTLVAVVTTGLELFSDLGIGPSIAQNKRGDDPAFLDTAWTIQVVRGGLLWLLACALALPVARFYAVPELGWYLPVAAFSLVISGFLPTRIETAYRHLLVGRLTALDLASQALGVGLMIGLAALTGSVWALVLGGLLTALTRLALTHFRLPGAANRFRWEPAAAHELIHFGKWIFLSTIFSFFSSQGDKLVFGKLLTLVTLGVYNIGYYLGSFPVLLGQTIVHRVMIPIYRDVAASGTPDNARKLIRLRYTMTAAMLAMLMVLAYGGPALVGLLYDARYHHAGAMLVLIAVALSPQAIGMSYDRAALAAGDSRRFFAVTASRAVLQIGLLYLGARVQGLVGAIAGLGLAGVLVHPVLIWLAVRHRVWDPLHDALFALSATALAAGALWLHADLIGAMAAASG